MPLIDPAPIDIRLKHKTYRLKELHGKKILITMCLFWLEARFAFSTFAFTDIHDYQLQFTAYTNTDNV